MQSSLKIIRNHKTLMEKEDPLTLALRHNFVKIINHKNTATGETTENDQIANQVIEEANKQAEEILAEAHRKAKENARQLAEREMEKAYEEGFSKGYEEGLTKANNEAKIIRNQASVVLKQAETHRAETLENLEKDIINLSVDIAQKLIARQLSLEPETVISIAHEAIQLIKTREKVTIFINPAENEVFELYKGELHRMLPANASLDLITDEAITPGGCIVETEHGKVEATLESRWDTLLENLGLRREDNSINEHQS